MRQAGLLLLVGALAVLVGAMCAGCGGNEHSVVLDGDLDQVVTDGDQEEAPAEEELAEPEPEPEPELEPEPEPEPEDPDLAEEPVEEEVEEPAEEEQAPEEELELERDIVDNGVYVSDGDSWLPGPLWASVAVIPITQNQWGAPKDMYIYAPTTPGTYAVVFFNHGFVLSHKYYSTILRQLASHGFIVIAPQMYPAGAASALTAPKTDAEAVTMMTVQNWYGAVIDQITGVHANVFVVGMLGHSRGGKVVWKVLKSDPLRARAVAGIDPVDSQNILTGESRVVDGSFNFHFPSYVLGTGLGPQEQGVLQPACAPAGDNHVQFYAASASPAYHALTPNHGHLDMLDDDTTAQGCGLECTQCAAGPSKQGMRALVAAHVTAFFRASLQGDLDQYLVLTNDAAAPINVASESK